MHELPDATPELCFRPLACTYMSSVITEMGSVPSEVIYQELNQHQRMAIEAASLLMKKVHILRVFDILVP